MTELLYEILGSWIRAGLMVLSTWLIEHHIVTATQGDQLSSELFKHALLVLPAVGSLAWSVWQKYKSRITFLTALASARNASEAEVKDTIKQGFGASLSSAGILVLAMSGGLLFGSGMLLTGCAPVPASLSTPQARVAYTADQIVQRVGELEQLTIDAGDANKIPVRSARIIVSYCVSAAKTLKATPAGWQATVAQGWDQVKQQIDPADLNNPAIAAAVGAVDAVLVPLGVQ